MRPVLKRIAVNGLLTAVVLAVLGMLLTELADMWMVAGADRAGTRAANEPIKAQLRNQLPLSMAGWGFGFIAVAELILFAVRRKPRPAEPATPEIDPAEVLLEELLRQAETALAEQQTTEIRDQKTDDSRQKTEGEGQQPAADDQAAAPMLTS